MIQWASHFGRKRGGSLFVLYVFLGTCIDSKRKGMSSSTQFETIDDIPTKDKSLKCGRLTITDQIRNPFEAMLMRYDL